MACSPARAEGVLSRFGRAATFGGLSAVGVVGAAWLARALPETAGKSLEEIEGLFKGKYAALPSDDVSSDRNPLHVAPDDDRSD